MSWLRASAHLSQGLLVICIKACWLFLRFVISVFAVDDAKRIDRHDQSKSIDGTIVQ
jgi:hypothetical protein